MLRAAFKLPLRQAEGLMASVVELQLLAYELAVHHHSTVSRRAAQLTSIARDPLPRAPLHVLIDSTGLKVYGAGEWLLERQATAGAAPGASCASRWTPTVARSWRRR